MRLVAATLNGHRSVEYLDFEAGPFTVLFGKNNAGKTNILETIYGLFVPNDEVFIRRTPSERPSRPEGALVVDLEPGLAFDDSVTAALGGRQGVTSRIAFTHAGVIPADAFDHIGSEIGVADPSEWSGLIADAPELHLLFLDWQFSDVHRRVEQAIGSLAMTDRQRVSGDGPWLQMIRTTDGFAYQVPPAVEAKVEQLSFLATDLLPDFVDGGIRAHVTAATLWSNTPKVLLEYEQRGLTQCADSIDAAGHGAARWMAAAVQIALHLAVDFPDLKRLRDLGRREFSGHVLLVDEPEAHLHPSAVASMVRWCNRMADLGFTVIVASHHEEFLRATGNVTLVHVTRDPGLVRTRARTLPSVSAVRLQELADEIGVHPATALSLNRAILFVEGPLDQAVLDEYGGLQLDASGVKVLPIHGTKNLEGLVASEVVTELGIRIAILTDATNPTTMSSRSGKKRSSEERKVLRVINLAVEKGLPVPTSFGIAEEDLLFVLPADAIRAYLCGPFPGWKELVGECRAALGKGPSDSVDWKQFALDKYDLPITSPAGVRDVVRSLDLAGVQLPALRRVIDQIVSWVEHS